jgi:hypothetical protein
MNNILSKEFNQHGEIPEKVISDKQINTQYCFLSNRSTIDNRTI